MAHQKFVKPRASNIKAIRDKFASFKPFEKMIEDGDVCDIEAAARLTGFSEAHLRRLCHYKKIAHEVRNGSQYWFTPEQIAALRPTTVIPSSAKA